MASTYSTNLRIEKMADGENSTTWGSKTNTNWDLIEQAVSGVASVAMTDADYTLTTNNAASDEARNAVITITGTLTQARNVIVPSVDKQYVFKNSTTGGFSIVVKTAAGTGITVLNGETEVLYCDATNVLRSATTPTGSGAPVRATSPTLVTPALGTPTSGVLTNCTSYPCYPSIVGGTRFVFVGDSKTDGPTDPTSYPYYFSQLATSASLGTVYNLGVSGYTLADLISNYTANVKPYRPGGANNLTSIPTVLSVWIGANDLYQLISAGYTDGADYYNDLATYVNTAIADGFRVMMWTIDARGDHVDATTEFYREFINAAIRRNDAATWIVDPETVFWDYNDTVWWNADMIHYNAAGYSRLSKLVAQTLLAAGAPGDLKPPRTNKLNTWTEPQAFTGEVNYVSGAAGTVRGNYLMTALVARFLPHITATAESGSNVGSDYAITSYTDAGAVLTEELLKITRSTGKLTYKGEFSTLSTISTGGYTVATLPAGVVGKRAYVTDALGPAYGVAVVGGGAVTVPVFYNGAAWICA